MYTKIPPGYHEVFDITLSINGLLVKHSVVVLGSNYIMVTYRRRWLLSACANKIKKQGNMRLIKNMRLTASVRLIERA